MFEPLTELEPGMAIVYGGDRITRVDDSLARAFRKGDRLVVVQETGDLLHIPEDDWLLATRAIDSAYAAFSKMGSVPQDQLSAFFNRFADNLGDDEVFEQILSANRGDVERATARGRSTTRLLLTEPMRRGMIEGLRAWVGNDVGRNLVIETVTHDGWVLEQIRSGLGVVGFVFEGRPNVFADATGVLAAGNTVVFRIGSDALDTARAIMDLALAPALAESGLPDGAVVMIDTPSRAAGWAMFSDSRLSLAVARGSGTAVAQLGAVARQSGVPVSLHGTGGAWIVAGSTADAAAFGSAVLNSLDRKVCNSVNAVCIVESRTDLIPVFLDALDQAGTRLGTVSKLHVTESALAAIPESWMQPAEIFRAVGPVTEPRTELIGDDELGVEWEWEQSPEVSLTLVPDVDAAIELFNTQSPRLAASLISEDEGEHQRFFDRIDAPFVGNGFTRWVDGQFALDRPELGLSNWEHGRLLGRSGILSGDSVYTVRTRAIQSDPDLHR